MKFSKRVFSLLSFIVVLNAQAFAQEAKTTVYKGKKFTLEYPAQWKTSNDKGILNFYPEEDFAAFTVSYHSEIDVPLENMRQYLLDMYEVEDKPENVTVTKKGDVTEFSYEFVDKDVKWVTKAFRKKKEFYLLTVNCELSKWEANKDTFLKALKSFKII